MPFNDNSYPFFVFRKEKLTKKFIENTIQIGVNNIHSFTKHTNHSSSSDSSIASDFFLETANASAINDESTTNQNLSDENSFVAIDQVSSNDDKKNLKDSSTDNLTLESSESLSMERENFNDCSNHSAVRSHRKDSDKIIAQGETAIFSSNLLTGQSINQSSSRLFRQSSSYNVKSSKSSNQNNGSNDSDNSRKKSNKSNLEYIDIYDHLALTVLRLEDTIKSLANRMDNLEIKVNQKHTLESSKKEINKSIPRWSRRRTLFFILWPFVAHLIMSSIKKKLNKQSN